MFYFYASVAAAAAAATSSSFENCQRFVDIFKKCINPGVWMYNIINVNVCILYSSGLFFLSPGSGGCFVKIYIFIARGIIITSIRERNYCWWAVMLLTDIIMKCMFVNRKWNHYNHHRHLSFFIVCFSFCNFSLYTKVI